MLLPVVKFPSELDDSQSLFHPFNVYFWRSALKNTIDASPTTVILTLTDTSDIPAEVAGNYIGIDDEIMYCESVDNSLSDKKITVIRAQGSSTIATHLINALVIQTFVAEPLNQHRDAIIAIEQYLIGGGVIGSGSLPMGLNSSFSGTITSNSFTQSCSNPSGAIFDLTVSVQKTPTDKISKGFSICTWIDVTNNPQSYESFLFQTNPSSTVGITLSGLVAGSNTFSINITNSNGGTLMISSAYKGRSI